jgi:hypothetical protein
MKGESGESGDSSGPPPPEAQQRLLCALRQARAATARLPTDVWPKLDHDGVTTCGYEERLAAGALSLGEAAEADAMMGRRRAEGPLGRDRPPSSSKPVVELRAAVAEMLCALELPALEQPGATAVEQQVVQGAKLRGPAAAAAAVASARALHSADALSFARGLAAYATPWARDAGERLALSLARLCPAAREELLAGHLEEEEEEEAAGGGGGGGSSKGRLHRAPGDARARAAAMVGGALVSRAPFGSELFLRGVEAACLSLDACSGEDFARFCGARPFEQEEGGEEEEPPPVGGGGWAPCPLERLRERLLLVETGDVAASKELEACRDAFRLCLGRARRAVVAAAAAAKATKRLGALTPLGAAAAEGLPSNGFWARFAGLKELEAGLVRRVTADVTQKGRGGGAVAAAAANHAAAAATSLPPSSSSSSAAIEAARRAWASRPLRDPLPHQVAMVSTTTTTTATSSRRPRARLSWRQTSADVEVRLVLPLGTAARDVRVEVGPTRLRVWVSWLGCGEDVASPVVEGELYRRVKAREVLWTVAGCGGSARAAAPATATADDEAAELQLLLPKDEARRYWKGLFAGEEERGHLELLREAVDADETPADAAALDAAAAVGGSGGGSGEGNGDGHSHSGAAELARQLRERQALVASGELDLEHGFDDFRLVLSDEGL